jgi:mRNA interferase RelE/StbE
MIFGADPTPNDYIKLYGSEGRYRVDIGEYRVIYSFNETIVSIFIVGKRNDSEVYKNAKK